MMLSRIDGMMGITILTMNNKSIEQVIEYMEDHKDLDILSNYNEMLQLKKDTINGSLASFIEEKRQEIKLNSSEVLGEYIFAVMCHERKEINIYLFPEELINTLDNRMEFIAKYKRNKANLELLILLRDNPDMVEKLDFDREKFDALLDEEPPRDLTEEIDIPWVNKKDDMYLRYCEKNLWVEMTMQIEPSIGASKQIEFMKKLMGRFKYDSMHEEDKEFKYDISDQREKLRTRRKRALKDYRQQF